MQDGCSRPGGKILSLRTTVCLTFLTFLIKFSGPNFQQPQINIFLHIFFIFVISYCSL